MRKREQPPLPGFQTPEEATLDRIEQITGNENLSCYLFLPKTTIWFNGRSPRVLQDSLTAVEIRDRWGNRQTTGGLTRFSALNEARTYYDGRWGKIKRRASFTAHKSSARRMG
ncbi:MAG: hypothetical protein PHX72_01685 [Candidatus Shapirobacteria bacterium]|nr:hypothetical protein [Candidatus Shapirobacteria bacterium]